MTEYLTLSMINKNHKNMNPEAYENDIIWKKFYELSQKSFNRKFDQIQILLENDHFKIIYTMSYYYSFFFQYIKYNNCYLCKLRFNIELNTYAFINMHLYCSHIRIKNDIELKITNIKIKEPLFLYIFCDNLEKYEYISYLNYLKLSCTLPIYFCNYNEINLEELVNSCYKIEIDDPIYQLLLNRYGNVTNLHTFSNGFPKNSRNS